MILRPYYLNKIKPFLGKGIVKAVTGMRRSGKSVFVRQLMEELKLDGIPDKNIIYVDKESLDFNFIMDFRDLDAYVREKKKKTRGKIYIFIDEVQDIDQWERAVASWSGKPDQYDIVITGSNSTMFSGELASKLTGRYLEFTVYPLSLREFRDFYPEIHDPDELLQKYLRYGGMPGLRMLDSLSDETVFPFLNSIHDSIVLKDIVRRKGIRNMTLLESICDFVYGNIGCPMSANSIAAFLKNQRINTNVQSVINYMDALTDAQLVSKVRQYDIRGKRSLEIDRKMFVSDLGMRHCKYGFRAEDISQMIENLVYMELRRKYDRVSVGNVRSCEVDFVAWKASEPVYFQVTAGCSARGTLEREVRPLLAIQDNYPKVIVSLEKIYTDNCNGIKLVSLTDFLLGEQSIC